MAELVGGAFLSSFLQVAFEKLASSEMYDFFRGRNLKEGLLKKLNIILISVNQVIEDAEERQYRNHNVKKWLDELKDEVFKAGDLLDEIATEASLQKLSSGFQNASRKVRGFFNRPVNLFDKTIESRLQQVLDNLEYLIKQNEILGLKADFGTVGTQVGVNRKLFKRMPTSSLIDESAMYGRDDDKENIIDKLLSHRGNEPVNVVAIIGLGGMGKTTLGRLVYEDQRMKDQFQLRIWLTVSEEFDVLRITKEILQKLECPTKDSDDPRLKLKEILKGKTFFLVLDDVWNENRQMWEGLQAPFNYGASGSKILVTTRNKKVADVMNSAHVHPLKKLEDENCWKLFAKHAFSNQQNGMDPDLVPIGKKIVEKCGGLPLAIKTLGSLLRTKLSPKDWTKILESDIWNLSENDSNIIPSLRLSYHYLPSNLKQCFAYCSVFPKDYEIEKDVLIQLWMAEGLLSSSLRGQSMQEVGNEFFNDLESRSLFEPSKNNEDYFVMHDLVNDLAKSVVGEFCLQLESDWAGDIPIKVRYLSYFGKHYAKVQCLPFSSCSQLRSFMLLGRWSNAFEIFRGRKGDIVDTLFSRATDFNHMRVLSLNRYSHVKWLRNSIGNFKQLRYLDFSYSEIKNLPSSICLMINLQTLKLKGCESLTKLPSGLTKLMNLYHLDLEGSGIKKMPKDMGKLNQLETMSQFVVGEKKGYDLKELGALNRIRGTLVISKLENVIDPAGAREAKVKDKNLEKLELRWEKVKSQRVVEEQILVAFQPNCDIIKEVVVEGYGGAKFPNWFSGFHLPTVVSLKLSRCRSCTSLPPLGQLPLLKTLEIDGLNGVKVIGEEFYGNGSSSFRSLTYLSFRGMAEWEEWNNNVGGEEEGESSFPCLEELYIHVCPKLRKSLPQHLPSLKELKLIHCPNLESSVPKAPRRRLRDESAEMESLPHQHHPLHSSLRSLQIWRCPKLMNWDLHHHLSLEEIIIADDEVESFPEEGLLPPNVKSLQLWGCSKLKEINYKGLLHLHSLQSLEISYCPILSLESIPEVDGFPISLSQHLPSLKKLELQWCPKVMASRKHWDLHHHLSLEDITIGDPDVESFPEEGLLPPNVKSLTVWDCSKLKEINYKGLLHLHSLQSLNIVSCPILSLESIPEVDGFPKSLSHLNIWGGCPLLEQRCQREKGQDWHKISHIPNIEI